MKAYVEDEQPCRDPECSGVAEPEVDGAYRYLECVECGYQFAYERVDLPDDTCGLGVPEEIRRMASIEPGRKMIPLTVK